MTAVYKHDHFTAGFYIATILAASLCRTAMILILHRTPDAVVTDDPIPPRVVRAAFTATALLVLAFVLAVTLPGAGYYALLVLLLTGPLTRLWGRTAARSRRVMVKPPLELGAAAVQHRLGRREHGEFAAGGEQAHRIILCRGTDDERERAGHIG